ncbi:hypothetical protein FH972_023975 [Carpinus fangiana]|uniref:Alpha-1,3-glucosyltransferase n=1 Tax=Carpinus fangiana TaxID=176857 RepID=A0A5N6KXH9_9ROSI|nr:hypothetical protein FH972_023975 [Carpinus fangiana]
MSLSTHKPRRGNGHRSPRSSPAPPSRPSVRRDPVASSQTPAFPLQALLWSAKGATTRWTVLPLVLMTVGLYRWSAGLWGYSGFQVPPMHGDFEAQRHWMEITLHLPITQWYFHDLEWWGLDYPPLTAYHSWICGKLGSLINPQWFALHASRGLDDPSLKVFMRATALVSEYLTYIPAMCFFVRRFALMQRLNAWDAAVALTAILLQPGLILIDHAHFQYNAVMLGFVVASLSCLVSGKYAWAATFFVGALGFKQMALYYAPAIFAYLLGSCLAPRIDIARFSGLASATVVSFAVLFLPLALGAFYDWYQKVPLAGLTPPPLMQNLPLSLASPFYPVVLQLSQSIHRIFPFARGLFEDKVANFWCAAHTFHKLHHYPTQLLQRVSLGATLASILPPCVTLGLLPQRRLLPLGLATTAWGFFLFSFQVHEKSVLLPLMPMLLLLAGEGGLAPTTRAWVTWANVLGSWTMFPLLKRDELRVPYFVLTLFWAWLMGAHNLIIGSKGEMSVNVWTRLLHSGFYVAMSAWHIGEAFVAPPKDKPDIWVVVNVLIGTAGFGICYLWCLWRLMQGASFGSGRKAASHSKKRQ